MSSLLCFQDPYSTVRKRYVLVVRCDNKIVSLYDTTVVILSLFIQGGWVFDFYDKNAIHNTGSQSEILPPRGCRETTHARGARAPGAVHV